MAIDLISRFANRAGGYPVNRQTVPVRALIVHHTAGWYGSKLDGAATQSQEVGRLEALTDDHRARFGMGPGYTYAAFPSGRLYALRAVGMSGAHTKGRNPETGRLWNEDGVAVVAFGNYETDGVPRGILDAIKEATNEVAGWPFTAAELRQHLHGTIPTVNKAGVAFDQQTACPGRHLKAALLAPASPAPDDLLATLTTPPGHPNAVPLGEVDAAIAALIRLKGMLL